MTILNNPTFIYPNGGEDIWFREITITWEEPTYNSQDYNWYEIFFTDNYTVDGSPNWIQIASLPVPASSFDWNMPVFVKGAQCRFAIRLRNQKGERSEKTISASDITIKSSPLESPAVFSPSPYGNYFSYVPIIFNQSNVVGKISQRAFYRGYYSSETHGIDWTVIPKVFYVGSPTYYWNVENIPSSNDYSFKFELVEGDSISKPVFINNVNINVLNYFTIDTIPPKGTVKIRDSQQYTNKRDVVLDIQSFDETTAVKSVTMQQSVFANNAFQVESTGIEQNLGNIITWQIYGGEDGVKYLQAKLKDYGDNVELDSYSVEKKYFRVYNSIPDNTVSAIMIETTADESFIWAAFAGEGYQVYKGRTFIVAPSYEVTAMNIYSNVPYFCLKTSSNTGILQRYINETLYTLMTFTDIDSVINSTTVFNSLLILAMENGDLYSFNGTILQKLTSFENSITGVFTDNNLLYIMFDKSSVMSVYDGYSFSTVSSLWS